MQSVTYYRCEICFKQYDNPHAARKCEAQGMEKPVCAVGDIVELSYGYGWYDGDRRWVINPRPMTQAAPHSTSSPCCKTKPCKIIAKGKCPNGDSNCFSKCCTMGFFYVVTAIEIEHEDRGVHRLRYHCFTKAIKARDGKPVGGWTVTETHTDPKVVKNPPAFVVKSGKELIGMKSKYLT